jgi:hypothetical protein
VQWDNGAVVFLPGILHERLQKVDCKTDNCWGLLQKQRWMIVVAMAF